MMNIIKYTTIIIIIMFCSIILTSASAREPLSLSNAPKNLIRVPLLRQSTNYTCGVSALQSVLFYYGEEHYHTDLVKSLAANKKEGVSYNKIAKYAKKNGYNVEIIKNMSLDKLIANLDQGKPVILAIQAWNDQPTNYANEWDSGHYVVAIGYDNEKIYFMDPSALGTYTYIPIDEFLIRWHDIDSKEKINRLGIVITRQNATKYNHNQIIYMQ